MLTGCVTVAQQTLDLLVKVQILARQPLNDFAFGPKKRGVAFWPFGRLQESDGGLIAKIVLRKTFLEKVFLNVPFQKELNEVADL